jgi:thiamine biosynthesis protein ThiS
VKIILNGLRETVEPGITLSRLIADNNEKESDLIVELNGRYIYPKEYASAVLSDGDEVELINPDFGG